MMLLRHLDKPRTIAELRALTGLPHPELTAELRRLGRAVREIKPTTVNDRAIRYQRATHDDRARDPSRLPRAPEGRNSDPGPDPASVPRVESVDPSAGSAPETVDDRPVDDRGAGAPGACGAVGRRRPAHAKIWYRGSIIASLRKLGHATLAEIAADTGIERNPLRAAVSKMEAARSVSRVGHRPCGARGGRGSAVWALVAL